ncbi:hypothetical protein VSDG_01694 [Cytospora chrysosperma]|uniref:Uncharacterized protein n=1 Tax=Cytospora chrysosperma TaxID=252740 RepID=A0A423WHT8_CYTCH|nr:hypothetical protein VSDG_01694 [Valsa sordida]
MEARMPKDGPTQEGPDQISPISWTILNDFQARSHMGRRDCMPAREKNKEQQQAWDATRAPGSSEQEEFDPA